MTSFEKEMNFSLILMGAKTRFSKFPKVFLILKRFIELYISMCILLNFRIKTHMKITHIAKNIVNRSSYISL